jgi:hypothetical protein
MDRRCESQTHRLICRFMITDSLVKSMAWLDNVSLVKVG